VCVVAGALSPAAAAAAAAAAARDPLADGRSSDAANDAGGARDSAGAGPADASGCAQPGGGLDAVGVAAVHTALAAEQDALLWRAVREGLEAEVRRAARMARSPAKHQRACLFRHQCV